MNYKLYIAGGLVVIMGLIFALGFSYGEHNKKCPEVKCPEITRITDTIIKYDTVLKQIYRSEIKYTCDTIYDTIKGLPVTYEENCLSINDSVQGVSATMCSKEFPSYKPTDLHGSILIARPPDTQRTIRYVDTIRVNPSYKWFAISVGPYTGYNINKKFDIGVGINIGIKIKEF